VCDSKVPFFTFVRNVVRYDKCSSGYVRDEHTSACKYPCKMSTVVNPKEVWINGILKR
jgi:hypothetical protein